MKFYKGTKRLFNTADLETIDSDYKNRYIEITGITDINELRYSIVPVFSTYDAVSLDESDVIETTFYILNEKGTILANQTIDLPVDWVYSNQIYYITIDYQGNIIPFGANIESLSVNSSDGTGTGFTHLPSTILEIDDTYTSEQILEAFGGEQNIAKFKQAVRDKIPILFYSEYSETEIKEGQIITIEYTYDTSYITSYQTHNPGISAFLYTNTSGTPTVLNMYDSYKISVHILDRYSPELDSLYIKNLILGFKTNQTNEDITVFNIAASSDIYLSSDMIGDIQELKESLNDTVPIGSGMDYFGINPPENYMFADGSAISRTEYTDLFDVIGTIYGDGDGSTTFNLPDKRTRVSVMKDTGTFDTLGKIGGEETHTLTVNEMPSHSHTQTAHTHNIPVHNATNGATSGISKEDADKSAGVSFNITSGSAQPAIQTTGGSQAHNNLQPYLVCNYIIKVKHGTKLTTVLEGEY